MSWLPTFAVGAFAIAGAIAALGPILIHLLNRRRFRVVSWAAMDFLQEAVRRNRRWLRIRDLLLLALRTLAVLLVGLALARPYWSASEQRYDGTQPLHLILLIDNSLSMGYESLEGSLLDRAVQRAEALIDRLPDGSRISVLPTCGSALGHTPEAATQQNARELLRRIEVADRAMQVQQAWNLVRRACETGPPLARRAVLFSDQQRGNWTGFRGGQGLEDLPDLQVVDLSPASWQNTWVTGFRVQDGIADASTPTQFLVGLRHQGPGSRTGLQVTLAVDGIAVASTTVSLEPGPGVREVAFPFSFAAVAPERGKVRPVAATVSSHSGPLARGRSTQPRGPRGRRSADCLCRLGRQRPGGSLAQPHRRDASPAKAAGPVAIGGGNREATRPGTASANRTAGRRDAPKCEAGGHRGRSGRRRQDRLAATVRAARGAVGDCRGRTIRSAALVGRGVAGGAGDPPGSAAGSTVGRHATRSQRAVDALLPGLREPGGARLLSTGGRLRTGPAGDVHRGGFLQSGTSRPGT